MLNQFMQKNEIKKKNTVDFFPLKVKKSNVIRNYDGSPMESLIGIIITIC